MSLPWNSNVDLITFYCDVAPLERGDDLNNQNKFDLRNLHPNLSI
jgi:hypothetical protein